MMPLAKPLLVMNHSCKNVMQGAYIRASSEMSEDH